VLKPQCVRSVRFYAITRPHRSTSQMHLLLLTE